jgi:hypothetical protein
MEERLPGKCKALCSVPSTEKKKKEEIEKKAKQKRQKKKKQGKRIKLCCCFMFAKLEIKPGTLRMLCKCATIASHSQPGHE